jgi:Ca2+-binding EF-hand superfamily protein
MIRVLLATLLMVAGPARAEEGGWLFAMIDSDGDRSISRGEYDRFIVDTRRSGAALMAGESDEQMAMYFQATDKDGDGALSPAEFTAFGKSVAPSAAATQPGP